jgi:hypothetical protein
MPGPGYSRLKDRDQGFGPKRRAIVHTFGVACLRYNKCCPKLEAQVLGKFILQLGTFVEANCREAHRGRSKAEFIAKCEDSRRKLEKMRTCSNHSSVEKSLLRPSCYLSVPNATSSSASTPAPRPAAQARPAPTRRMPFASVTRTTTGPKTLDTRPAHVLRPFYAERLR